MSRRYTSSATTPVVWVQGLPLPSRGVTYYVLFFIQLESRRVCLAGITPHPEQQWMEQMGRNVTMQKWGFLANSRYLLHDRDTKFCMSFRQLIEAGRVKTMPLPARSPNLNAYAERWVRSVKQECLSKLILFPDRPLHRALQRTMRTNCVLFAYRICCASLSVK